MVQQNTAKKNKGPPKFQHLPKARAKQLKFTWVQTRKIKSKWNAEKRREGIRTEPPSATSVAGSPAPNVSGVSVGQTLDHQPQPIDVNAGSDASPSFSKGHPVQASPSRTITAPVRMSKNGTAEGSSQQKDRRSRRPSGYQGKTPTMRNRMSALLEKIQREID